MTDGEQSRGTEAELAYWRTLDEVAAHQAVAAAEDVISAVWVDELEKVRGVLLVSFDSVWARAGSRQAPVEAADDLDRLRGEIDAVQTELERVCVGAVERSRGLRDALARLRCAWIDAYGEDAAD